MQANNEINTIHIKVFFNNEFRRFSINTANFCLLEQTIRTAYSLPESEKVCTCYFDDEDDKVALSSDQDIIYALELVKQPLRLFVTLASSGPTPTERATFSTPVESEPAAEPHCVPFRGRGRGRGRKCWGEGKAKWREEKKFLTFEEIRKRKIERITQRIEKIESLLLTDLPPNRDRTLAWKLGKLKAKLDYLTSPGNEAREVGEDRGDEAILRGRGRGGGRGRRGGKHEGSQGHPLAGEDPIRQNLQIARRNLRAAYQTGNSEEIQKCTLALEEAKFEKKEAKRKLKAEKPDQSDKPLWAEKKCKRECLKNLRDARSTGDKSRIEECEFALIGAKETLMKAKLEMKC